MSRAKLECIFQGGLGNQIFQYLAAEQVRKELCANLIHGNVYHYGSCSMRKFELSKMPNLSLVEHNTLVGYQGNNAFAKKLHNGIQKLVTSFSAPTYIREKHIHQEDHSLSSYVKSLKDKGIIKKQDSSKIVLDGYWQKPQWHDQNLLDSESRLGELGLDNWNNKLFKKGSPYIAVHNRRSDYIQQPSTALEYSSRHSQLQYILAAISIIPERARMLPVVIVTDDPEWCGKWLYNVQSHSFSSRAVFTKMLSPWHDWGVLSNSELCIISNSTFAFTAAWLSKKLKKYDLQVIMPEWFTKTESMYQKGWSRIPGALSI